MLRKGRGNPRLLPLILAACLAVLAGCASRPGADVLRPVQTDISSGNRVKVIAATNRQRNAGGVGFNDAWAAGMTYEIYGFSAPPNRTGTAVIYPTTKPDPERQYVVTARRTLGKSGFLDEIVDSPGFDGVVAVFVHGYNYSYQEALYRTAQVAADSGMPTAPILFSWPSAAALTGYVADRDAALYSRSELDALVTTIAASSKVKQIVLFGHSMGGFLTMEAVRQLKLEGRDDVIRKLAVVLAAPDIDVDVFRSQLLDIGRIPTPITLLVAKTDRALFASSLIARERPRVGQLDINDPIIGEVATKEKLRVVDITSISGSDGLGHDRYTALAKYGAQLASYESSRPSSAREVGAFVFDAAGAAVANPFRVVRSAVSQ